MLSLLSEQEKQRWIDTMPILAAITNTPPKEGSFVRSTEWGSLYLDGEYYILVRKPKPKQRNCKIPVERQSNHEMQTV